MDNQNEIENMAPMEAVSGSILKTSVSFFLPKGWKWLMNKIYGKKLLVVGLGRSGKTSFKNYLLKGLLLNENDTPKTSDHVVSEGSIININNGSFEVQLKSLIDSPGQMGPLVQAEAVSTFNPHFLFVFLNCEKIEQSIEWFEDFTESLYSEFKNNLNLSIKIKSIIIILNKYDKITGHTTEDKQAKLKEFSEKIKSICIDELNEVYYKSSKQREVPIILPAICIKNYDASKLLEEIINTLASKI